MITSGPSQRASESFSISKFERVLTLKPGENYVNGHENLKRLKETGRTLLDDRVLEELLNHPNLIPEEWKKGYTYFWGTIFRGSDGGLYVPYLCWVGGGWHWYCNWLDYGLGLLQTRGLSGK